MPQTTAKIMPRISSLINGFKNKNDKNAPSGSVIPDQKEYLIALYRLPVEKYIGIAMAIPSGILCRAIAKATDMPKPISWYPETKVAIPSGKLCSINAIVDTKPTLNNP